MAEKATIIEILLELMTFRTRFTDGGLSDEVLLHLRPNLFQHGISHKKLSHLSYTDLLGVGTDTTFITRYRLNIRDVVFVYVGLYFSRPIFNFTCIGTARGTSRCCKGMFQSTILY